MSILEGLIAADRNKATREEVALRKQAAERQNEEFGWRRDEQARAAAERRAFEEERGRGLDMYGSATQGNPFLERLGMAPQRAQMQPPAAMPQGVDVGQPMAQIPQGQPGLQQQGFAQHPTWQALQQQMRLARTPEQMAAVHQGAQQFQQAQQRSGLYDAVMNATPDQMVQFSQKFSDFSPVRGKTDFDPKTGLTRLTLENGKPVMLNRAQMAQMVEGMHRMSQGDATGIQALAGVNKDLAASAKEDFDRLVSVTTSGNDVAYKSNAMLNDNARTGIAAQGLKQRERELGRPDLIQMYDKNNNVVLVDKRTMTPVTMPEGLRMPKLPQELTERQKMQLTAYNKALEGLPSDVPRAQLDALASRYGVSDILGGAGGLSWGESPAAKPATTPQQPPVQGLRQPQITTLSAPRSGAEARGIMQPQLSDEELFIRSMGVR